jgi:hypothetical protein
MKKRGFLKTCFVMQVSAPTHSVSSGHTPQVLLVFNKNLAEPHHVVAAPAPRKNFDAAKGYRFRPCYKALSKTKLIRILLTSG